MISIHALREEGDCTRQMVDSELVEFLSTPSARRATHKSRNPKGKVQFLSTPSARRATSGYGYGDGEGSGISIHALREEGDVQRPI